jgi:hypothetical protein
MNAVRHGLLARCVVLDNESRDCFDQVVTQYLDCFRPANDVELGMVEEMIAAAWRQRRAWAIETSLMDTAISKEPGGDELIRIAAAYTLLSQQPQSALISRYEARLHRCSSTPSKTSSCSAPSNYHTKLDGQGMATPGDENGGGREFVRGVICQRREKAADLGNGALLGP